MSLSQNSKKEQILKKVNDIKGLAEKFAPLISGGFFVFSSLIQMLSFKCHWSDFILILITLFFLALIILHTNKPDIIPPFLREYFGIISYCGGKGFLLFIFGTLFISYPGFFQTFASILLIMAGIALMVLEFLVISPTDPSYFPNVDVDDSKKNNNNNATPISNDSNIVTKENEKENKLDNSEDEDKEKNNNNNNNPFEIKEDF
jgi:hypothetical protein